MKRRPPAYARRRSEDEASWQRTVVHFASLTGWRWYHPPDNRPNARGRVQNVQAGFPDLFLLRSTRIVIAELKTDRGRVSPEQVAWLSDLRAIETMLENLARVTGGLLVPRLEVYVWRPRDWDEVQRVLAPEGTR